MGMDTNNFTKARGMQCLMLFGICIPFVVTAQYPSFELGGLARGVADVGFLTTEDTLARDVEVESHAIYDLALKGNITAKAEVYAELRLGTNLALFDTSASYAQVRRVLLAGELTDHWRYEVGDMDVMWTPFTIWNSPSEGSVAESDLFSQWRRLQDYENFSESNSWRLRGAKFEGKWSTNAGGKLKASNFISRLKASDEVLRPDVVLMGSAVSWERKKAFAAIRIQDLASLGKTIPDGQGSHVASLSGEIGWTGEGWSVRGEVGGSSATTMDEDGFPQLSDSRTLGGYWHAKGEIAASEMWKARISARSVSDTYISPAAQTKRISFDMAPASFAQIGNGVWNRSLSQGDLLTAPYLPQGARPWNRVLQRELMAFDPRYGTASPYGMATPNRRGMEIEVERGNQEKPWSVLASISGLQDLTPEGGLKRRSYLGSTLTGHFDLAALWSGMQSFQVRGGWQGQHVRRPEAFLAPVELTSSVLDVGVDWAMTQTLRLGYGAKRISSEGLDYVALRDANFTVVGFDLVNLNLEDQLHAWGLTWRLNERTEASLQWQRWSMRDDLIAQDGKVSRALFLFQTKF